MHAEPFAVTSLDAGMFSVVAFFFADEAVLCYLGAADALKATLLGDRRDGDVATWCRATRAGAKQVLVVPDGEIQSVRVRLRMMQNQLIIALDAGRVDPAGYRAVRRADPSVLEYNLLERDETEPAARLLADRFGGRFELLTTRAYAFFHRVAPVLTR